MCLHLPSNMTPDGLLFGSHALAYTLVILLVFGRDADVSLLCLWIGGL